MKSKSTFWPFGLGIAFILFFCSMATVVVIAATHRESLVSDNYYEQELKFQDRIDAAARAEKAGADIAYDQAAGRITVTLPAGQSPSDGTIQFYRPSGPDLDRQFDLAPAANGIQALDVSRLAAGNWSVRVSWKSSGQDYYLERRFIFAGK